MSCIENTYEHFRMPCTTPFFFLFQTTLSLLRLNCPRLSMQPLSVQPPTLSAHFLFFNNQNLNICKVSLGLTNSFLSQHSFPSSQFFSSLQSPSSAIIAIIKHTTQSPRGQHISICSQL